MSEQIDRQTERERVQKKKIGVFTGRLGGLYTEFQTLLPIGKL